MMYNNLWLEWGGTKLAVGILAVSAFAVVPARATVMIDSFDVAPQKVVVSGSSSTQLDKAGPVANNQVIGQYRDIELIRSSEKGKITVKADKPPVSKAGPPGLLTYTSPTSKGAVGTATVVWDGGNGPGDIDYGGLGGKNLYKGGANTGIRLEGLTANTSDVKLTLTFYHVDNQSIVSSVSWTTPTYNYTGGDVYIPFVAFKKQNNNPAAATFFKDIGAISLEIDGVVAGGHMELNSISAVPELSTWFMGAGAFAILLCFAWTVHSQGSGVIWIRNP